ncbi:MAG: metal ABC transporter permease, partial [Planctomycetota bacterium]
GILAFWLPWARRDLSRESVVGYAWATAIALATLVVALNPGGELHDLDLLSGNLLFLDRGDLLQLALSLPVVWLVHALLRRELVCVSVDPDGATVLGLSARGYELLLHLSIGLTIAVSMRLVGVLFVFASLVVPAAAGLAAARSLGGAGAVAVLGAVAAVVVGVLGSFALDLPTGPTVVVAEALLLPPALLWRAMRAP